MNFVSVPHSQTRSSGYGQVARFVADEASGSKRRLMDAIHAYSELDRVYSECVSRNWDGYDALPVSVDTYALAQQFLDALPPGTPLPSFGALPDGHLTAEWHRAPRWTLSVQIGPDAELNFAVLFGDRKICGSEPFFGDVPDLIVNLIRQVTAP
jgi:hypothetical protein